jgi:hypothetical protein
MHGEYYVTVTGTNGCIYVIHGKPSTGWSKWIDLGGQVTIPSPTPIGTVVKCPDGTYAATDADCPPVSPVTVPDQPQDVTLLPVEPIPEAKTDGLTIVLRDHKKKPT